MDIENYNLTELKELAKEKGIKNISKKKIVKKQIVKKLKDIKLQMKMISL